MRSSAAQDAATLGSGLLAAAALGPGPAAAVRARPGPWSALAFSTVSRFCACGAFVLARRALNPLDASKRPFPVRAVGQTGDPTNPTNREEPDEPTNTAPTAAPGFAGALQRLRGSGA